MCESEYSDTNVIVRFLVRDDERQSQVVYALLRGAEDRRETFLVTVPVLLETLWVLDSVYNIDRSHVVGALDALLQVPTLEFEAADAVRAFVSAARVTDFDLPDLLIGHGAQSCGSESVLTFDKRAARSSLFELIRTL
ncbi:type II toxin-antitoxin system VapC family toxin [Candidatus Fermentibacteria bacterium]|nr:type II toxin-antitoxin system VapC family toxin [Candidatus Fermentibacteria bacterium]